MKIWIICIFLLPLSASAFFETGESGEISKAENYKIGLMPQIRLTEGSGMNITGFFDKALNDESSYRVHLGGGETDFYAGGSYKWMPIPDYENQPAIGGKIEAIFGQKSSNSLTSLRVHPLISKKFDISNDDFSCKVVPYASIPISFTTYKGTTDTAVNVVGGSEYTTPQLPTMEFGAEIGLNGNKSFSYISAWVTILLDQNLGHKGK